MLITYLNLVRNNPAFCPEGLFRLNEENDNNNENNEINYDDQTTCDNTSSEII